MNESPALTVSPMLTATGGTANRSKSSLSATSSSTRSRKGFKLDRLE